MAIAEQVAQFREHCLVYLSTFLDCDCTKPLSHLDDDLLVGQIPVFLPTQRARRVKSYTYGEGALTAEEI